MALTFFGKSENEREKDLANQIEELKKRTDELAKSNKALQDSADLQRQKAETAEAALTAKDEELRKAFGELQALQKEIDDIKAATTAENEKNAAVVQLMADKDAKIASLEKAVADKDAEIATLKAAPAPEQKPQEVPVVITAQPAADYAPQLNELKSGIEQLKESYSDLVRQNELFNAMHKELDTLRNDLYSKLTKPYKLSIISLYDSIMSTYNYYRDRKDEEGSFERLMKQLNNYILSIVDLLCDEYGLDSFEAAEGEPFDRRAHKTMNVVDTDDPAKHGTVARALQCGFKYTAFDPVKGIEREVVFRPAFVDTYKLKEK